MKITEKTVNALTGEEVITERDETSLEAAERVEHLSKLAAIKLEAEATALAKAALLTRLGITADEARLLLS